MAINTETIPDEVMDIIRPYLVADGPSLESIAQVIAEKRDHAKQARQEDGLEDVWSECEEAYVGIDDANRNEFRAARWSKPMSSDGPVQTDARKPQNQEVRSTVFVRLTARYVDAAAAMLQEILLPADDKAFSFTETPVPDLIKAKEDNSHVFHDGLGTQQPQPLFRNLKPGEPAPQPTGVASPSPQMMASALPGGLSAPQPGAPSVGAATAPFAPAPVPQSQTRTPGGQPAPAIQPQPGQAPLTVKDLAEEAIELARKKAKKAEKRIYDWMVKSRYAGEMRKVVFDAAKLGVGVLKGPFPKPCRKVAILKDDQGQQTGIEIQIKEELQPSYEWRDPWNIFPDPACGENIHDGDFIFERDYLSPRQVRLLKKQDGYIEKQIDRVLEIGPPTYNLDNNGEGQGAEEDGKKKQKGRYEVWYYYGTLKRDEYACVCTALGNKLTKEEVPENQPQVFAIVTMIGDVVVKAVLNPLDSGTFPYHSVPWQRRTGSWAGIGVSEQVRVPQRMLNASTRALLDNAGKSAGSQYILNQKIIRPANQSWTITRDKIWYLISDMQGADVRSAFNAIQVPNVTDQLMKIINYAMQLAEESSSIPLVSQGREGDTTPDTFGAAQLQNNNANRVVRMVGYAFDDYITEPVVMASYEYLLMDPDVPEDEKGDFQINAHGSVALVERAIQDQTIAQMAQIVLNPAYGWNPKKWAELYAKSKRLDGKDLSYTEEEQAKIDANPVKPVPVQVAETNADATLKVGMMRYQGEQATVASEERLEQAAQALEGHKTQVDATVRLHELEQHRQLEILKYANTHQMNIDQVKMHLADTTIRMRTEQQLNAQNNIASDIKHRREQQTKRQQKPPVQAPGKSAPGHVFDQKTA